VDASTRCGARTSYSDGSGLVPVAVMEVHGLYLSWSLRDLEVEFGCGGALKFFGALRAGRRTSSTATGSQFTSEKFTGEWRGADRVRWTEGRCMDTSRRAVVGAR